MAEPSAYALACDLIGADPFDDRPGRPPVDRAAADCPPGAVVPARRGDQDVAVFVLADGRTFVAPDRCPHDGGWLSDGFVEGQRLVCSRHNWEFDACSGRCVGRRGTVLPIERLRSPRSR